MDTTAVFDIHRERGDVLLRDLQAVFAWAQQTRGFKPTPAHARKAISLRGITAIVQERRLPSLDPDGSDIDLAGMPEALTAALKRYLAETPGYDPANPTLMQPSPEPANQHLYVLFGLRRILAGLFA